MRDIHNPVGVTPPEKIGGGKNTLFCKEVIKATSNILIKALYFSLVILSENKGGITGVHLLIHGTPTRRDSVSDTVVDEEVHLLVAAVQVGGSTVVGRLPRNTSK